ncbi:MAG TPA: hypothetical protein VFA26_16290 [Gemmataceae bacterium]|nr:hypothetical protein [Gemmataceae bacterium]
MLLPFHSGRRSAASWHHRHRRRLELEELEQRCLLTGAAAWISLGPAQQLNPNGPPTDVVPAGEATTGRVTALAFGMNQQNQQVLYAGAAGGGVWQSADYNTASPHWTPLTDTAGSPIDNGTGLGAGAIDVGSLVTDGQTVYVGTGEANDSDSRYGTGILKSINGGATFSIVATGTRAGDTSFFQHSISKLIKDQGGNLYAAVAPPDLVTTTLPGGPPPPVDPSLGIYMSTDGGTNWTKITGNTGAAGQLPDGTVITDLEYTGTGANIALFAGVGRVGGNPGFAANNGI